MEKVGLGSSAFPFKVPEAVGTSHEALAVRSIEEPPPDLQLELGLINPVREDSSGHEDGTRVDVIDASREAILLLKGELNSITRVRRLSPDDHYSARLFLLLAGFLDGNLVGEVRAKIDLCLGHAPERTHRES